MGLLEKALPRDLQPKASASVTINSPKGVYRALFIGMENPWEWVSDFAVDKCRACKGTKNGWNGEPGGCQICHGTGRRTELHTKLRYHLETGILEEEEVNFKISPPGIGKDGQPLSPSTLFLRLRTLSGIPNATEQQLDDWYTALGKPIKVPCQVVIDDNKTASALKIANVLSAAGKGSPPAPAASKAQIEEPFDESAFESWPDR